jgi:hypothetical protein
MPNLFCIKLRSALLKFSMESINFDDFNNGSETVPEPPVSHVLDEIFTEKNRKFSLSTRSIVAGRGKFSKIRFFIRLL